MASVPPTVWVDILDQVKLNYPDIVRGWFSELQPAGLDQGTVRITTGNDAQAKYLQQHCVRAFSEAAQAATGRLLTVAFLAPEPLDPSLDSTSLFPDRVDGSHLNPDYSFENFVTGPCNRLAHAAATAVADAPGRSYNPFFIHGPVGLGKTHLLQAVCHLALERNPNIKCHYISCETFINDFIEAAEGGDLHQFRYRYRHVDLLVIDDIQFLAERERSQEEFFHTFNTLHQSQRQIILSADCSPSQIPSLEERLISRFNSGLVALLDRPCLETRMSIVRKKAKLRCIEVPEEVIRSVASRIETNIRELEGALIKIDALCQTESGPITLKLARQALGTRAERGVSISTIMDVVAERFGIRICELQGKKRLQSVTRPRHICMHLARKLSAHSLEEIGGYFGGRDHTTVLHAVRGIGALMENYTAFRDEIATITAEVESR